MMRRHRCTRRALLAAAAFVPLAGSSAPVKAGYPGHPIRLIFGFPAGSDGGIRIMADKLADGLGKPVLVENITGAGGNIAADRVAKSTPDGHTIGALPISNIVINPILYTKLPYDPIKDLSPVTQIFAYATVLVVNNDVPARTVQELVALARASPGQLTFGHSGVGTVSHLSGERMRLMANIDIQQVPYRGPPQITTDLIAKRLSAAFLPPGPNLQFIRNGQIRGLAVTTRARARFVPDLPTMIEAGFPDFEMTSWFGVFVPSGTPRPIVERLNAEFRRVVALPEVDQAFLDGGGWMLANTPEEFAAIIKAETGYWARFITDVGIKPIE